MIKKVINQGFSLNTTPLEIFEGGNKPGSLDLKNQMLRRCCQFLCFFSSQIKFSNYIHIAFVFRMSMHSQNKGTLGNTFNNSQYFDGQK